MPEMPPVLSVKEAAGYLGVSSWTVYEYCRQGGDSPPPDRQADPHPQRYLGELVPGRGTGAAGRRPCGFAS